MLWLAKVGGLWRFDGVRFEKFQPRPGKLPGQTVYALQLGPDGALWVG